MNIKKTIFLTSFYPLISRNILSTGFLGNLVKNGVKVVILAPKYKKDYFEKSFVQENVVVEGVLQGRPTKTLRGLFFKRLAKLMLPTSTVWLQQRTRLYLEKNYLRYILFFLPARVMGKFKLGRNLMRFFCFQLAPRGIFNDLLDKYKPDAIFSTDIQNENDVNLMQEARSRQIPVISMVRSWDNLTVHGIIQILPDKLLVGADLVKRVARQYHDVSENLIQTVGIPHYDAYKKGPTLTREQFYKNFALDSTKKLILYAPLGDRYIYKNDLDSHVLEILSQLDAQILVRFPPTDTVNLGSFRKAPNMVYHQPGAGFKKNFLLDQEISREDDESLINSLAYSDLLICGPSTMAIDAAIFGKPSIFVDFYRTSRPLWERSIGIYFHHIQELLESGGVKVADTPGAFFSYIDAYLNEPALDADKREKIVDDWAGGKFSSATEELTNAVLDFLNKTK